MALILLVLIPLLAGLVCWSLRRRDWLERLNLLAHFLVAALALLLGRDVLANGTVEALGGLLRADALSALVVGLTAFVGLACSLYAVGYLREEERLGLIDARLTHRYYVLTPIFVGTMMAVPLVNNLGLLWVVLESTTLESVLLVRFYNRKSSLEAAWKYIIIGGAGMSLALFGTILTYFSAAQVIGDHAENGFNWSVLIEVADKCQPAAMRLGFVMILVGYGTKAGLVPMHTWKPDAYAEAPVPSVALLGAAFVNCALYGLMRFHALAAKCLGHDYPGDLLILFGIASILVAAPFVLIQRNFRRLLAYSSIEHAGIMAAAIGFGGRLGTLGALLHMFFHGITKPLMFFCAGSVQQHAGTPFFHKVTGLVKTQPWTAGLFLTASFAITGLPPFGLFQSELTALSGAFAAGQDWAAVLFLVGIVTIFSGFLVRMTGLCLGPARPGASAKPECPWKMSGMILVAAVMTAMGVMLPSPIFELIQRAALLVGGAP
jgi:hydrogenase-4 component F